ncbi:MAG: glycoside hydrolase family 15 protein [Streptosporangiaceae bacterium]
MGSGTRHVRTGVCARREEGLAAVPELWSPRVLREYSFIADGERGGLVGPDGAIVWMCLPRWDSPAVFSALLGGQGGYAVTPADPWHVWGGYYEPASLIWRSRWVGSSVVECREALAMPGDPHRAVILRRIEARDGPAKVTVTLDVRAGYGASPMRELTKSRGIWTGRSGTKPSAGAVWFRWSGAGRARPDRDGVLKMTLTVPEGQHHDLVLEISDRPLHHQPVDPGDAWVSTEEAWAGAVPKCDGLVAARDAAHAHAVLTGLTSASGGMVAAATTSLPERLDGARNYDYRYAWIRDQCYAGIAMAAHGCQSQLAATVRFITDRVLADGPDLKPAYTVGGEQIPDESALRLPGYPGSSVRVGNRVRRQFQLDSLGEVLQLLAAAAGLDVLDADGLRAAEVAASAIAERWTEPEAGVWELDPDRWTHSRLCCVAGLRAMATATTAGGAPPGGVGARVAARWSGLADAITADMSKAIHPTGRWKRAECDDRVDAALLPTVLRGAIPAEDPRSVATVAAVAAELADDGFVYRFRHDDRPLYEAEGAFLLCGFWMALTAHVRGDDVEAAHWFERNRAACGPAGLYTEEYDVHQRQLRGNLPQAFVHAAMLECAVRLSGGANVGGSANWAFT